VDDEVFTNWTSIEEFRTGAGNNDITFGLQAQEAGIVTMVGGLGDDTFNAADYTVAVTLAGGDGADSLLSGAGKDSISGGGGDDWLQGTSATLAGVNEIDTLTGGSGNDTFVLGDDSNAYYNTAATNGDYALITDFDNASDMLQLRDLTAGVDPNGGYLFGAAIYGAVGGANSYLYVDTDGSTTVNAGDNLIAAIKTTGAALTTADLQTGKVSII
jgi:Ca2+-binding RTX toxin-like protein